MAAAMVIATGLARYAYTPILLHMVREAGLSTEGSRWISAQGRPRPAQLVQ